MKSIKDLISPYTIHSFLTEFIDKKAIYIPGESDKFEGLTNWDDINHFLNYGELNYPRVRLAYSKDILPEETLENIYYYLRKGSTLIIDNFAHKNEKVSNFLARINEEFIAEVQINCYVSWTGIQGFDCHYDAHDVFIIQVEGSKLWKVFEPTTHYPLLRQKEFNLIPPEKPYLQNTLSKGDVLYIPKGHWHYAISESPSIHLTLGISSRTGIDFLRWITDEVRENYLFRKNLPLFLKSEFTQDIAEQSFAQKISELQLLIIDFLKDDDLANSFFEFCVASSKSKHYFNLPLQLHPETILEPDTQLNRLVGKKILIKYELSQKITKIIYSNNLLKIENIPEGLLEEIFSRHEISGRSILAKFPELSWNDLKVILTSLITSNFLVFAS